MPRWCGVLPRRWLRAFCLGEAAAAYGGGSGRFAGEPARVLAAWRFTAQPKTPGFSSARYVVVAERKSVWFQLGGMVSRTEHSPTIEVRNLRSLTTSQVFEGLNHSPSPYEEAEAAS
ncbi:hypothetical protein NPIL_547181 [Nephila pilipes]|uniref:Uncharacterized protein n=1 Tax=Nephila pilipes TaxID=299642 RepID=A0A8X6MFA3_NEPPI|nr:hypothetical protein NPIL_547181 [Nephila pilipes]